MASLLVMVAQAQAGYLMVDDPLTRKGFAWVLGGGYGSRLGLPEVIWHGTLGWRFRARPFDWGVHLSPFGLGTGAFEIGGGILKRWRVRDRIVLAGEIEGASRIMVFPPYGTQAIYGLGTAGVAVLSSRDRWEKTAGVKFLVPGLWLGPSIGMSIVGKGSAKWRFEGMVLMRVNEGASWLAQARVARVTGATE